MPGEKSPESLSHARGVPKVDIHESDRPATIIADIVIYHARSFTALEWHEASTPVTIAGANQMRVTATLVSAAVSTALTEVGRRRLGTTRAED